MGLRVLRERVAWHALTGALVLAAGLAAAGPSVAFAQAPDGPPPVAGLADVAPAPSCKAVRIRPMRAGSVDAGELVSEAIRRSPTVRGLAASIEASDVIVWIALADVPGLRTGRLRVMGAAGGVRRLYVEIARISPLDDQITWLGHELWHAYEIAMAPEVVDADSLERLYKRIGDRLTPGESAFETGGAVEAGRRVGRELRLAAR